MSLVTSAIRPTEITIVVVLVPLLVLLPPLPGPWFFADSTWYQPCLIWFGVLLLSFWLQRLLRKQ